MDTTTQVAANLRRLKGKMKRKELAQKTGVSEGVLQSWLSGHRHPTKKNVRKLAKALSCRPSEIEENVTNKEFTGEMFARLYAARNEL